jgi:saccharopine dehydrogenase (NAD+, L-lysine-forming)
VLEAAIAARTHLLDITGEQGYLRHTWEQRDRVLDAGITVVNAMGFDVVPSDIAALVATTAMRRVVSLDIAIDSRGGLSGGTLRSMAAARGSGWWYDRGRLRRAPAGRFQRRFAFPAPTGPLEAAFVPWGDVVTAPRSTGAERVRTFFTMKPRRVHRLHRAWPLLSIAGAVGLTARRLRRKAPPSGGGPSPEERAAARFRILAEAVDEEGTVQRGLVSGRDPYGFTAASVVHGAGLLLDQGTSRGVLTPTQAFTFGPFVHAMERFDLEWRARSLDG